MAVWRRERDSYFCGGGLGLFSRRKEKGGCYRGERKRKNVAQAEKLRGSRERVGKRRSQMAKCVGEEWKN